MMDKEKDGKHLIVNAVFFMFTYFSYPVQAF
ncbi:hypothetical protein GGGNBK_16560 [Sporosarcina sp. ANT_H38]